MHFVMMMKKGMDTVQIGEVGVIDLRTDGTIVVGLQVLMAEDGKGAAQTMVGAGRGAAQTMARVVPEIVLIMSVVEAPHMWPKVMQGIDPSMTVNAAQLALPMKGPAG
jgi:hypothetical protein